MRDIRFLPITSNMSYITRVSIDDIYLTLFASWDGYELFYHDLTDVSIISCIPSNDLEYLIKRMHHIMENLQ